MGESENQIEMPKEMVAFIEKTLNWILPGLQLFYRDTNSEINVYETYPIGSIIRAGFFVDVTARTQRPTTKLRYLIASAHAANMGEATQDADILRWRMNTLHFDSYFKVMDIYERDGVTQVFLLHIPYQAVPFFRLGQSINFVEGASNINLVDVARKSLDAKMEMEVFPDTSEPALLERMELPIGVDGDGNPVPLDFMIAPDNIKALSDGIRRISYDLDPINYPEGYNGIPTAD